MFRSKTLFILGAGSSSEVGLPIGAQLKEIIARKIDIRFEFGSRQISGDRSITQAIRSYAEEMSSLGQYFNPKDINPFLEKAWELRDALPIAISIDNLLDAHKEDQLAKACGKLGIVKSILEAENSSSLYKKDSHLKIDLNAIEKTWFSPFFQILTENVSKSEVHDIFKNVSFINFNYDRCVEQFLFDALQIYYGLNADSVKEIFQNLVVLRPYGSVGLLPVDGNNLPDNSVSFGSTSVNIFDISKNILTFNEQIQDKKRLSRIHEMVSQAEIIVFLGFAYHRQNLELLTPNEPCSARMVYGTAHGISNSDIKVIQRDVLGLLGDGGINIELELNVNKKCYDLFSEYWRGLSSKV